MERNFTVQTVRTETKVTVLAQCPKLSEAEELFDHFRRIARPGRSLQVLTPDGEIARDVELVDESSPVAIADCGCEAGDPCEAHAGTASPDGAIDAPAYLFRDVTGALLDAIIAGKVDVVALAKQERDNRAVEASRPF